MFKLSIRTDNAAFDGDCLHIELARILRDVARRIEDHHMTGTCRDTNGNVVGDFHIRTPRGRK